MIEETDFVCQADGPVRKARVRREKIPSARERAVERNSSTASTWQLLRCRVTGWRSLAQPLLTAMVPYEFLLSVLVLLLVCLGVSGHSLLFQRWVEITIHGANKHLESRHEHQDVKEQ